MKIYVDVFIFENFIVNLFLLLLSFKLLRLRYRSKLLYTSALLGGVYALVIFCNVTILSSLLMKLIVPMIMIYISIENRNIINILKCICVFFMLSFMLGGMCFGLVLMQNTYIVGGEFTIKNNSIKQLILAVIIIFIFITRIVDSIKDRAIVESFIYDIYINEGKKTLLIKGFLDTGNELREAATNLPCIIIENSYFKQFDVKDCDKYTIRYNTISEDGELKGFKGETVKIRNSNNNDWINVDAIICGCERKLSKTNDFHALLSRGVV